MKIKTGTYTGTGVALSITGVGFTPDVVFVKGDTAQNGVYKTWPMGILNSLQPRANLGYITDGITTLDGDGLSLGTNAGVNSNGVVYYYTAMKDTGSGDICIGGDWGTGSARNLPLPSNFTPTFIFGKGNSTATGVWRTSSNSANNSITTFGGAAKTTAFLSFAAGIVAVGTGTEVNTSAVINMFFAMGAQNPYFQVGTYTGNGTAKTIPVALNGAADMIWVGSEAAGSSGYAFYMSSMPAGKCGQISASALASNLITAVSSTGFTVGASADVNTNAQTYVYAAWKGLASGERAPVEIARPAVS